MALAEVEREMAEALRSIHIERKWDVAEIAAIVAAFDARKAGALQADVLRDSAKGDC